MLTKEQAEKVLTSFLSNGELVVPLARSNDELREIADGLREACLSYEIPHYKVVGAKIVTGNNQLLSDFVTKSNAVNKSYAELVSVFDQLVWAKTGGLQEIIIPDAAEHLVGDFGFLIAVDEIVTSSNGALRFAGAGGKQLPECLIKDQEIIKLLKNDAVLHVVVKKGSGVMDFPVSSSLLRRTGLVPYRQVYDLTNIFTIRMVKPEDTSITFCYKKSVSENVLHDIILGYAESIVEGRGN